MIGERQLLLALDQMGAHHAGDRIAVASPSPASPSMRRLQHQLLGMRGAAQEGEIRGDGEFECRRTWLSLLGSNDEILSNYIHIRTDRGEPEERRAPRSGADRSHAKFCVAEAHQAYDIALECLSWKRNSRKLDPDAGAGRHGCLIGSMVITTRSSIPEREAIITVTHPTTGFADRARAPNLQIGRLATLSGQDTRKP